MAPIHNITYWPQSKVHTVDERKEGALSLIQAGPRLSIEIHLPDALAAALAKAGKQIPPPVSGWALIDTGATSTCIDAGVVTPLGLTTIGTLPIQTPAGSSNQSTHPVKLAFPGSGLPELPFLQVIACDLANQGLVALLGRDFLVGKTLIYNGTLSVVTLAF